MTHEPVLVVAPVIEPEVIDAIIASLVAQHKQKLLPSQLEALERALKRAKEQMLLNRPFRLVRATLHVQSTQGESVEYECTLTKCECEAFDRRRMCWHRALLMILLVAQPLNAISTVVSASMPYNWSSNAQIALAA